jgi:restriction endonuclease S subunit
MIDWLSAPLDVLCEVEYGTRVTRKRDGGSMYPVYGGGGATFYIDDFNRQDQMIISRFAMSEECVRFVSGKFFLNDSGLTVRTRDESKLSQTFLDRQLLTRSNEIYLTARGTAQKNMDMSTFGTMELTYPDSLDEQTRIVALLDDANARITELAACYRQARAHVENLFESALRDALESNLDWPVVALGDLMTVQNGYAFDSKYFSPVGKIGLIRIRDLRGGVDTETRYDGPFSKEYKVSAGDYLIGMDGDFRCYEWKGEPALLNQRVCRLQRFSELLEPRYLFHVINRFLKEIEDVTGYTTVKHLSSKSILAIEMPMPPREEQRRIVERLDQIQARTSEMCAAYDMKLQAANNLRQSILESAFSGEL